MTDKELRKLRRSELVEILLYMRNEIDKLKAENEQLVRRIDGMTKSAELSENSVNQLLQGFRNIAEEYLSGNAQPENHDALRKESGEKSTEGTVTEQHG